MRRSYTAMCAASCPGMGTMSMTRFPRSYWAVPVGQVSPKNCAMAAGWAGINRVFGRRQERAVARDMVAMAVRVQDEQRQRASAGGQAALHEGVDGRPEVGRRARRCPAAAPRPSR